MYTPSLRSLSSQLSAVSAQLPALVRFVVLLVTCHLALVTLPAAQAAPIKFNIPAQPAADALVTFSKQSGIDVLYSSAELKKARSQEVVGEFESDAAIKLLLKDTGFEAQRDGEKFVVARIASKTASIKGTLLGEGGKGLADVLVALRGTALSVTTNSYGEYFFSEVEAGAYVLVATSPGYLPLHIVDVNVKAGRDLTLGKEELRKPLGSVTVLDPIVVHADATTELEKIEVTGTKQKPFEGANMDLPRTVNDAQPYYIFDSKTIERTGAMNIGDLLKKKLTMNSVALTNGQTSGINTSGNTSSINLRGLGADKTLILVNGRRMAGVNVIGDDKQPDLNGIPMSAIDRIEVLPSSASGIYGGSAMGGVVNVILKKDYSGGEIRATYDNTFDSDSPVRTVSASYGVALEGGKTHVMVNASWSDAHPLLLADRRGIYEKNLATINANAPSYLGFSGNGGFLGALPNVINSQGSFNADFTIYTPNPLRLKPALGGAVLSSGFTYVTAGTSDSTPLATVAAGLVANSGSLNMNLPLSTQAPTGLLRPFGVTPETKSFQASVNRQMTAKLELFADFSYNENNATSVYNTAFNNVSVPTISPVNPFTTTVRVRVPDSSATPQVTESTNRGFTVGAIAQLPGGWTGELDYSWSKNQFQTSNYTTDFSGFSTDVRSGVFNPFVDTLLYQRNFQKYMFPDNYGSSSILKDVALRGSGPLWSLPWGMPNLTVGLEHRISDIPDATETRIFPITTFLSSITTFFGRESKTDSGYAELLVPLAKKDALPFVHALELQLSGRSERYTVDAGTIYYSAPPDNPTGGTYSGPTLNGAPYFSKAKYNSTNGTVGLKFQPVAELTLRASLATAFLPPTPSQLIKNPQVDDFPTTVLDPKTGGFTDVLTTSGGNPDLKPQHSKSFNVGAIWEPRWKPLQGLRVNVEYYKIDQYDAITSLQPQQIVNQESLLPGRVTRNSTGTITQVDTSSLNLYKRETEGWDLSADYTFKTGIGTFNLMAVESIITHLKTQYDATLPAYDGVNFPSETNGAAKYKSNVTLSWEWRNWTASWTTLYYGSYKQVGAAGGPDSQQFNGGAQEDGYILPQGSDTIPSQTYNDLFVGYAFGKQHAHGGSKLRALGASVLDGLTVQLGVRNVFDKAPPFDVYYGNNYYESPYGDMRLRSYWLTVKKAF